MSVVMLAAISLAGPANAAVVTACDIATDPATSFRIAETTDAPLTMRIGCARDAGSLSALAGNSRDLIVAFDVHVDEGARQVAGWDAEIRDAKSHGKSLTDYFSDQVHAYETGLFPHPADELHFNGNVYQRGTSLVMVVSVAEVGTTTNWWQKALAVFAGFAAQKGMEALCGIVLPIVTPPLVVITIPVCSYFGNFMGGLVGDLANSIQDGRSLGEPAVWAEAFAVGISTVVFAQHWNDLVGFVRAGAKLLLNGLRATINFVAVKVGLRAPLATVADGFEGFELPLWHAVERVRNGLSEAGAIRVMPLGDSITYGTGSSTGAGYRVPLYEYLTRSGGRVEFVGSQYSGPAPDAHEGHPGWTIGDITTIANSALATYRPNVVLLQIGTNDMNNNVDPAGAPARLGNLIDRILSAAPETTLVVSTIVPSTIPATQERIVKYNQAIPGVVAARRAAGKHVTLADLSAVTTADLADFLHPNDAGYRKTATAFFRGVLSTAYTGWIVAPGGVSPGAPVKGWYSQGVVALGTMTPGSYPGSLSLGGGDKVLFGDVNGDGRADYLVSHSDGSVHVWVNGGAGPDGAITWVARGSSGFPYAPGFLWQTADMDVDGRADLLQINADTGAMVLYLNGGTDSQGRYIWNSQGQIALGVGSPGSQVRLADISGDGRPDYLDVAPDSSVRAWLNASQGAGGWNWFAHDKIAAGVGSPGSRIRFADLNGDGKADYLDVAPDGVMRAWLNGAPDSDWPTLPPDMPWFPQGVVATGVGSPGSQIQLADLDGDHKADYLDVNPVNGGIRMWKNFGAATGGGWLWAPLGSVTTGNSARIVYADLNGDRKADYLQVNADSSVQAWLNGGPLNGGWVWNPVGTVATGVGVSGGNVRFADLNGDGRADYLALNADSSAKAWLNGGAASGGGWLWSPQDTVATGVGSPAGQIRFADINGDGRADYLDVAPNSSVKAWLNAGAASGGGWLWIPTGTVANGVSVAGGNVRFAPLYGTARADYVALGDTGTIDVWQNGGGPGNGNWLWLPGGKIADGVGSPGNQIQLADITGDGRADYLDVNPATGATRAWTNAS